MRLEALPELMLVLLPFGMVLVILSQYLLVVTADSLASFLTGAMCAFGVFTANPFGLRLLATKLLLSVLAGLWNIFNLLDRTSPTQPYLKFKFSVVPLISLLFLSSLVLGFLWLSQMTPETLVSWR